MVVVKPGLILIRKRNMAATSLFFGLESIGAPISVSHRSKLSVV